MASIYLFIVFITNIGITGLCDFYHFVLFFVSFYINFCMIFVRPG